MWHFLVCKFLQIFVIQWWSIWWPYIPDICHFFSTDTILGYIFLHTEAGKLQKIATKQRKTPKKSNFATKQCKMQQDTINWTHNEGDFKFLHICHVKTFEIKPHVEKFQISPHDRCIEIWNFSTWPIFFPRTPWQIWGTRSLGALRAPTSSLRPFRPLWLRPSRPSGAQAVWPTQRCVR